MNYVNEYWADFKGYQACTIHQVKQEFKASSLPDMDKFCGILVDNMNSIEDMQHVSEILKLRTSAQGLN